jgi:hypothetical protein
VVKAFTAQYAKGSQRPGETDPNCFSHFDTLFSVAQPQIHRDIDTDLLYFQPRLTVRLIRLDRGQPPGCLSVVPAESQPTLK